MIAAALLILAALYLNRADERMLMLTTAVGVSYFLPVYLITVPVTWYYACVATEATVFIAALVLRARASESIMFLCLMLSLCHITGLVFPIHAATNPYEIIVPYLEYLELLSCSLFSTCITNKIKEGVKWIL